MAKIITLAQTKGGVGKTTLSLFLYQYFESLGVRAALLDRDEQKSITELNRRFDKELRIINPSTVDEIHTFKHLDFIIADTPPYRAKIQTDLFRQSDFVLIPCRPSLLDAMAAETILADLQQFPGLRYAAILTQVRAGVSFTDQIREYLGKMGLHVLKTEMFTRVAYSRGLLRASLDEEGDTKAAAEIAAIAAEILSHMAK